MICKNCNTDNPDGVTFCANCGSPLEAGASTNTTSQSQYEQGFGTDTQPAYQQAYNQPPYQQAYNQTSYQQPQNVPYGGMREDEHVSVGGWIGVMFLNCIPIVGIIMLFVWAFGSTPKKSLKNYARATLLVSLIFMVIAIVIVIILACTGALAAGNAVRWSYHTTW